MSMNFVQFAHLDVTWAQRKSTATLYLHGNDTCCHFIYRHRTSVPIGGSTLNAHTPTMHCFVQLVPLVYLQMRHVLSLLPGNR